MKRLKQNLQISLLILVLLAVFLTACSRPGNQVLDKDVIRIGMELKYPPFETKDESGNPMGASVDLARGLGEYLGKEIKIVDTPYPSLIPALMSGEIDLIISSMTITPVRAEKVDFSNPYTTSQLMMLVHK
ncbi:MAG: transporter substrate-binding domain-containing protein, partial [bacterium]